MRLEEVPVAFDRSKAMIPIGIFCLGKIDQSSNNERGRLGANPPMKFRHLEYFVAAAEELNFTHAADRLHVSQPPFSKQIHELEGELMIELFERQRKGVALTPAGKSFLIDAQRILEDCDASIRKAPADQSRRDWGIGHWIYVCADARFFGEGTGNLAANCPRDRHRLHRDGFRIAGKGAT